MSRTAPRSPIAIRLSRPELALISITVLWGATFLIVHQAMQVSGPLFFVGVRFVTAGAIGLLVFRNAMIGLTRRELFAGIVVGISIVFGYTLQTAGLQTISSSKSAFITALYVPFVPLLQWGVLRRRPLLGSWIGIGLAFTGLILLAGPEVPAGGVGRGEIMTLIGAVAIAAEILLIGRFASEVDARRITVVQLATGGLPSFAAMPLAGEAIPGFSWIWVAAAAGLGTASVLIQLTMNWAQKAVSPTKATVIYAGEPVWAGIVGRIAGDRLPAQALAGGALIVLGIIASEVKIRRKGHRGNKVINGPDS